jgi:phage FluMu protein Com
MHTPEQQKRAKLAATTKQETSLRCGCGSLLARVVADGVELKCRRCKRHVVVPFDTKNGVRVDM